MPTDRANLKVVKLRVDEETRALIDKAASIQGCSRANFIIEAARHAADEAILDQRVIVVSRESYDQFLAALERPPESNEELCRLFRTKAPWDQ